MSDDYNPPNWTRSVVLATRPSGILVRQTRRPAVVRAKGEHRRTVSLRGVAGCFSQRRCWWHRLTRDTSGVMIFCPDAARPARNLGPTV